MRRVASSRWPPRLGAALAHAGLRRHGDARPRLSAAHRHVHRCVHIGQLRVELRRRRGGHRPVRAARLRRGRLASDADDGARRRHGAAVTAISLKLAGPRTARYAQWVTLRASVTPNVPVTLRGRRFVDGKLRVRVLGTAPWIANALGVKSSALRILVTPKLVVRTIGQPIVGGHVRVVAALHPASARAPSRARASTRRGRHVAHVTRRSRRGAGMGRPRRSESDDDRPARPLALGARGPSVRELERASPELHYAVQADGDFGRRRRRGALRVPEGRGPRPDRSRRRRRLGAPRARAHACRTLRR